MDLDKIEGRGKYNRNISMEILKEILKIKENKMKSYTGMYLAWNSVTHTESYITHITLKQEE